MNIKYHVLFRACDKIQSVHNYDRQFGLNKIQIIVKSVYLYNEVIGNER